MTNKIERSLYNTEINITFYPDSHRYKLLGEKDYLVSVTSATGIIDKSRFLIPWAINLAKSYLLKYLETNKSVTAEELYPIIDEACAQHTIKKEEAADIGSQIHAWIESFANSKITNANCPELPEDSDERVTAGISAFLSWYNENKVIFLESERLIYSKKYKYVGLTDAVAKVNGELFIIDYKSGKSIYPEYAYQLSAYQQAYEEETGKHCLGNMVLHFDKENAEFTVKKYIDLEENCHNFETFLACLKIKKMEKINNKK